MAGSTESWTSSWSNKRNGRKRRRNRERTRTLSPTDTSTRRIVLVGTVHYPQFLHHQYQGPLLTPSAASFQCSSKKVHEHTKEIEAILPKRRPHNLWSRHGRRMKSDVREGHHLLCHVQGRRATNTRDANHASTEGRVIRTERRARITNFSFGNVCNPSSCTGWFGAEPMGHSTCTGDAWRHKDFMRQCNGDLQYSKEMEEGDASSACLVIRPIEDFCIQHSLLHDPGHSAWTVLTTFMFDCPVTENPHHVSSSWTLPLEHIFKKRQSRKV